MFALSATRFAGRSFPSRDLRSRGGARNVTERPFIDRSVESSGVLPTLGYAQGGLYPDRSLGVALRLIPKFPRVAFPLALNSLRKTARRNLRRRTTTTISRFLLTGILRMAGDGYLIAGVRYNLRTIYDLPFRQDETDYQATAGGEIPISIVRIGFGGIVQTTTSADHRRPGIKTSYGAHGQFMVDVMHDDEKDAASRLSLLDLRPLGSQAHGSCDGLHAGRSLSVAAFGICAYN